MPGQILGHLECILRVSLHPQVQSLRTLQQQESIEWRQAGARITQPLHARLDDERQLPKRSGVRYAVIRLVRLHEVLEPALSSPIELAAVNDDAPDRCAVPADVLRC